MAVPAVFRDALAPVVETYLEVQRALAGDDLSSAQAALEEVSANIARLPRGLLQGVASERLNALRALATEDGETASLDEARGRFQGLSDALIALLHEVGSPVGDLQITHCPMAFDFEGADWLQVGDEILNPYFGASMLRCGEVRATIAASKGDDDD